MITINENNKSEANTYDIYDEYGYSPKEAVQSIITNNLYGLDIDERATQLAYFAIMMKAREKPMKS